jgi:hypothetical protein
MVRRVSDANDDQQGSKQRRGADSSRGHHRRSAGPGPVAASRRGIRLRLGATWCTATGRGNAEAGCVPHGAGRGQVTAGRERPTQDDWSDHRPQCVVDVVDLEQSSPTPRALFDVRIHGGSITTGQRVTDVGTELAPRFAALLVVSGRKVLLKERLPQPLLGPACP